MDSPSFAEYSCSFLTQNLQLDYEDDDTTPVCPKVVRLSHRQPATVRRYWKIRLTYLSSPQA